MIDLLSLQFDGLSASRGPLSAVLAVVLAAILVVVVRDLLIWFKALGRDLQAVEHAEGGAEQDSDLDDADIVEQPEPIPAPAFVERRSPTNMPTGFGRRRSDVIIAARTNPA